MAHILLLQARTISETTSGRPASPSFSAVIKRSSVLSNIRWSHSFFQGGILANMISWSFFSPPWCTPPPQAKTKSPPKRPRNLQPSSNTEKRGCTYALIAVNVLVHVADLATRRKLLTWGAKMNHLVSQGQIWRMATSSLLHVDFLHLASNLTCLYEHGPMLQGYVGRGRFLAIYCISGLSGSLFSYWFTPLPSVGASDAICGLVGAQAVYSWRHRKTLEKANETLPDIALLILSNLVAAVFIAIFTMLSIDHWAHLGGLLGGAAVEIFLGPAAGKQHCCAMEHRLIPKGNSKKARRLRGQKSSKIKPKLVNKNQGFFLDKGAVAPASASIDAHSHLLRDEKKNKRRSQNKAHRGRSVLA